MIAPITPNRLRDRQPAAQSGAVWVADTTTYLGKDEGCLHVAGVLNSHTQRCGRWAMDKMLATSLPIAALGLALKHPASPPPTGPTSIEACNRPPPTGNDWPLRTSSSESHFTTISGSRAPWISSQL